MTWSAARPRSEFQGGYQDDRRALAAGHLRSAPRGGRADAGHARCAGAASPGAVRRRSCEKQLPKRCNDRRWFNPADNPPPTPGPDHLFPRAKSQAGEFSPGDDFRALLARNSPRYPAIPPTSRPPSPTPSLLDQLKSSWDRMSAYQNTTLAAGPLLDGLKHTRSRSQHAADDRTAITTCRTNPSKPPNGWPCSIPSAERYAATSAITAIRTNAEDAGPADHDDEQHRALGTRNQHADHRQYGADEAPVGLISYPLSRTSTSSVESYSGRGLG